LRTCQQVSLNDQGGSRIDLSDNLRAKPTLWLWELRDLGVIGVGLLIAVLALSQLRFLPPIVLVALYAFLSIRFDDTSILDFIKNAAAFFLTKQQYFEP
jgi:hypothetical protein